MRGLATEGIRQIAVSNDGKVLRLVLTQDGEPLFLDMPFDNFQAALPLLSKAVAERQSDSTTVAIMAAGVRVAQSADGDLLIEFENTTGARMSFGLDLATALELSALLDSALAYAGSKSAH